MFQPELAHDDNPVTRSSRGAKRVRLGGPFLPVRDSCRSNVLRPQTPMGVASFVATPSPALGATGWSRYWGSFGRL